MPLEAAGAGLAHTGELRARAGRPETPASPWASSDPTARRGKTADKWRENGEISELSYILSEALIAELQNWCLLVF